MRILNSILLIISVQLGAVLIVLGQQPRGLHDFPGLIYTDIPGAPRLSKPFLIVGVSNPVTAGGCGLASPAFWDWDGDGAKDLLIGEFGTGDEGGKGIYIGNFIRVYRNSNNEAGLPKFSGVFDYARPPFQYKALNNGTPYSVDQFCCMGFTPQMIDLNQDGFTDMISGQYQGEVSWFRGTDLGFLPGEVLPQEGNPRGRASIASQNYWLYSSASFGDFTGDGLFDLIIGGGSLRMSKNTGTKESPKFGPRELLLDVDGNPLNIYQYSPDEKIYKAFREDFERYGFDIPKIGDSKVSPYVVDWDNDGTLDLLVTNSYSHRGLSVIDFFKGVKINGIHRFQKAKPLFIAQNDVKAFPGSGPRVFVTDYNNDGVPDLLIGASIAYMRGRFSEYFAWTWEDVIGIHGAGKDPVGFHFSDEVERNRYRASISLPESIPFDDFMTVHHVGHVYVMLGQRAEDLK